MRVALGTIEIDDDTRKAIRKIAGGKGDATRGEVKDYLLGALNDDVIPNIGQDGAVSATEPEDSTDEDDTEYAVADEQDEQPQEPNALPAVSDEPLGDPTIGGTTAGGSGPSTGNLGAAGSAGGTV